MLIDITLLLVFVASLSTLIFFVSHKIPQLVAIPDDVIRERLSEDSAKFRLVTVNIREFYRKRGYFLLFLQFLGKLLHKLHIAFLKIDNWVVLKLRRVREKNTKMIETIQEQANEEAEKLGDME